MSVRYHVWDDQSLSRRRVHLFARAPGDVASANELTDEAWLNFRQPVVVGAPDEQIVRTSGDPHTYATSSFFEPWSARHKSRFAIDSVEAEDLRLDSDIGDVRARADADRVPPAAFVK